MRLPLASLAGVTQIALAGAVAAAPPAWPAPTMPAPPEALKPAIARMSHQIARVLTECQDTGERNPGSWDRRCPSWIAAIEKGGEAADWATWEALFPADPAESLWVTSEGHFASHTTQRLLDGLVARANPSSVTALVTSIPPAEGVSGGHPQMDAHDRFATLAAITGHDALPYMLTSLHDDASLACVGYAWRGWWAQHHARPLRELRAEGRAAALAALVDAGKRPARATLSTDDCRASELDVRHHAARRLLQADGDRAAAQAAILAELASPDLPAESVWVVDALAAAAGIPPEARETQRTARRAALVGRGDAEARLEQKRLDDAATLAAHVSACADHLAALRLDDAVRSCEAALALDSGDSQAQVLLGWSRLERGDIEGAEGAWRATGDSDDLVWRAPEHVALRAAILTVQGEVDGVALTLGHDAASPELDARRALLAGKAAPVAWGLEVAPRHACGARNSPAAAEAYLLRRGFVKPTAFTKGVGRLSRLQKVEVDAWVEAHCPWVAADAHGGRAR